MKIGKTMKTQRTIYHLIVDRSGSMSDCIDATINGFNEQINRIRSMETEFPEQDIRVGLSMFNYSTQQLAVAENLKNATYLNRKNYVPDGGTALFDAIGQTALQLEETFGRQAELPTTFVVVILTDGYENSSKLFNLPQIRALIQRLETTEKWTFSFLGATLDAIEVAESLSIRRDNSIRFEKEYMHSEVWDRLSGSMKTYLYNKKMGRNFSNFINDENTPNP
jgi:uncharacterized protein YegL